MPRQPVEDPERREVRELSGRRGGGARDRNAHDGLALRGGGRRITARNQQVGEREVGFAPGVLDRHALVPANVLDPEVAGVAGDGAIGRRDLDCRGRVVARYRGGPRAGSGRRVAAVAAVGATGESGAGECRREKRERDRCRVPQGEESPGHRRYHVTQSAVPPGLPP